MGQISLSNSVFDKTDARTREGKVLRTRIRSFALIAIRTVDQLPMLFQHLISLLYRPYICILYPLQNPQQRLPFSFISKVLAIK